MLFGFLKLNAQSNYNLTLRCGLIQGHALVESRYVGISQVESSDDDPNANFSVAFSLPVKGRFRLGAETGIIQYRSFISQNYNHQIVEGAKLYGNYRISQYFFAVVPEYRFKDWFYVQGGLGLFLDYNSYFQYGTISTEMEEIDISGDEHKRATPAGYFLGLGICPKITQNMSFLAEARHIGCPPSIKSGEELSVGYSGFNYNIGLRINL
jgi:hypothetical protein